jgi:hypothetical protein
VTHRIEAYVAALERWGATGAVPTVLVAVEGGQLLGSVNLLRSEMESRRLGWVELERVHYLGKERTIMKHDTA